MENLEKLFTAYKAARYRYPDEKRGSEEALLRAILDMLAKLTPADEEPLVDEPAAERVQAPAVLVSPRPPTPDEHYKAARKARGRPRNVVGEVAGNG